jgi:hypothetical protein
MIHHFEEFYKGFLGTSLLRKVPPNINTAGFTHLIQQQGTGQGQFRLISYPCILAAGRKI